jgi:DNA-binding MarR family transcriptional regulator
VPIPPRTRKTRLRRSKVRPAPGAIASKPRLTSKGKRPAVEAPFTLPLSTTRRELLDDAGDTDHRFRQLLLDFSTLGAALEVARAHLASLLDLSSPQYNIAMVIANHQNTGGISVSEVARRLHVSTAFIACEAGKLEQLGLVEKRPNPNDGRGILLRLSPSGTARVQRVGDERQRVNDHLFGSLTAQSFRDLSKTFATLIHDFAYTLNHLT